MPDVSDPRPTLPADEVHLWRIPLDRSGPEVARLASVLSDGEEARAARYREGPIRDRFIVGRGAVRSILAGYLGRVPGVLEIVYGHQGKPALARRVGDPPLEFNLAHSDNLGLLAVAYGRALGTDLERVRPMPDAARIAERFFSTAEAEAFRRVSEAGRVDAFFQCWTRKEAFIKAIGAGFGMPLDQFDIAFGPGVPPRLLRVEGRPEEVARWTMRDVDAGPGFIAVVAVEGVGWEVRTFDHS